MIIGEAAIAASFFVSASLQVLHLCLENIGEHLAFICTWIYGCIYRLVYLFTSTAGTPTAATAEQVLCFIRVTAIQLCQYSLVFEYEKSCS